MSPAPLIDYIVNAVWQDPLIAIGAAVLTRFGRLDPVLRHKVWVAALMLAVVMPLLPTAEALSVKIAPVAAKAAASSLQVVPAATQAAPARFIPVSLAPVGPVEGAARDPSQVAATPASYPPVFGAPPIVIGESWARAIALAYAVIVLAGLIRLGLAIRAASAIARRAGPADLEPDVAEAIAASARSHGLTPPPVRMSDEVRSPVVVGSRAPMILIPPAFARLAPDEQRAALLHEMAHVARRDYAVNLACESLSLPVCWHPVTWEIKAGARRSREAACDAIASGDLGSRDAYARRLISLADALRLTDTDETSPAFVALISKSDLEDRLMQLIKGPRAPSKLRLLAASAAAAAILAPAMLLHVTPALAQDATSSISKTEIASPRAQEPAVAAVAPTISAPATMSAAPQTAGPVTAEEATVAPAIVAATPAMTMVAPTMIAQRMLIAQADIPPPPAPPTPPAPPAPPAPPIPPDLDAQIDAQVRAAVRLATAEAERAMASEEVRKAMAQAHVDREQIRRQIAEAMNSPEVQRALAQARAAGSVEVRQALEEARRETARALDEAEKQVDEAQANSARAHADHARAEHRDHDAHDQP